MRSWRWSMIASARRPEIGVSDFRVRLYIGLIAAAVLALPLAAPMAAHAEGEDPTAAAAPKPHHRVVKKKKSAATAPAGPIPYTSLNPAAAKAPPPVAAAPLPAPVVVAVVPSVPPPPPPPPAAMLAPSPPLAAPRPEPVPRIDATEITLKCDTVTNDGKKTLSSGSFYIDLFPSQIFPDQQADFKFDQVDPRHESLVRDSNCMDTLCDAKVSSSAYYLVNRVTRHGAALRITLNRATGAFYAESIDPKGLVAHPGAHIGESGICVPQRTPSAMF